MNLDIFSNNRREGQLSRPQPLVDLFSGRFVAYQGQRKGTLPHRVVVYVKKPNDTAITELVDIPESAIFHRPPTNSYSPPEGHWVLIEGHEGVRTLAQDMLDVLPGVYARMAEANKKVEITEAKMKIQEKQLLRTQEEQTDEMMKSVKKVQDAARPGFDYMDPRRQNRPGM